MVKFVFFSPPLRYLNGKYIIFFVKQNLLHSLRPEV